MAWTGITRRQYQREGLRYASDLTNAEWALIEPLMPPPSSIGRPRTTELRQVVEAILYMASTGIVTPTIARMLKAKVMWQMTTISFARHQFPPAVIRHAVWLYARFTLSSRDVEELLVQRGLDISYETIRRWELKFGPLFTRELRRRP